MLGQEQVALYWIGILKFHAKLGGGETPIENRKLDIGLEFKCRKCGLLHKIVGRQWQYGNVERSEAT